MTLPNRTDRISRLSRSMQDPLGNNKHRSYVRFGQEKLGETHNNIVLEHGRMQSHNSDPANPGFTFSADGSELRTGTTLKIDTSFDKVVFQGKAFNPLLEFTPPNIASWYPIFVPFVEDMGNLTRTAKLLRGLL